MNVRAGFATLLAFLLVACGEGSVSHSDHDDHDADVHGHAAQSPTGQHGGNLLEQNGFGVELAIAEDGTPAKFQAWLYRAGKPLPSSAGSVEVRLKRLGNIAESHVLKPQGDGSLLAGEIVEEPHSFDVEVLARIDGNALRWTYASHEGRTQIAADIAEQAGIRVAAAGSGEIADTHEVQGLLTPLEGRIAKVAARYPGPVRSIAANVGDTVRAGQSLATIESNLSLTRYDVTAPIGGVVLARSTSLGSVVSEGAPLFEIADLSSLWVDLHIFGADAGHIQAGVPVSVTRMSDGVLARTTLERVLPGTATASQSTVARATIVNTDGLWRPGAAVTARITVEQQPAQLVVPLSALQRFGERDVVFIRVGETYEARPLELGKRDAQQVEVLSGLQAGDEVVVEQSYLIKADIEKSGASHEH